MALSDFIKVDLYGQYNNDTTHAYTFPERVKSQYEFTDGTRWVAAIADPRAIFQSVCKSGPCYIVYRHKNGYYYSLVERNLSDSRGGLEMITIFVPKEWFAAGNNVLSALKELRSILIRDRKYDDVLVKQCISRIATGLPSSVFPTKPSQQATAQPVTAFRTYKSDSELTELFSFLCQRDYETIDKLLFVLENDVKDGTSVRRILTPIKKVFSVVKTENASADKTNVTVGDSLRIEYTREGYEPMRVNINVDLISNNRFYSIDGNKLLLVGPDALKIQFSKKILILIESADRSRVETGCAEVLFDGDQVKRLQNGQIYAYVEENQITDDKTATLKVNCPHFEPYEEIIRLGGIQNNMPINVKLIPKKRHISMVFQFFDMGNNAFTLPQTDVQMNETDPVLRTMQTESSFFGYPVYPSANGYLVRIHRKQRVLNQPEERRERWPRWLKILVFSIGSLLVAFLLLLGGYALRSYDVVNIPGLNKPVTSGTIVANPGGSSSESKHEAKLEGEDNPGESSPADTTNVTNSNAFSETEE